MKKTLSIVALFGFLGASVFAAPYLKPNSDKTTPIHGDYVEARTAAVFAGACHYNGEFVCIGRDAVMAWNFATGTYNGVDLSGVRAMAAVTSDASLGDSTGSRKSELTVDSSATDAQVSAVTALLQARLGSTLGAFVAIHRAPIQFDHNSNGYTVSADKFGSMDVQYMPDNSCCTSPGLVWYNPLTPLQGRKVGYTEKASFSGSIADPWQRFGENSSFYGSFTF